MISFRPEPEPWDAGKLELRRPKNPPLRTPQEATERSPNVDSFHRETFLAP